MREGELEMVPREICLPNQTIEREGTNSDFLFRKRWDVVIR